MYNAGCLFKTQLEIAGSFLVKCGQEEMDVSGLQEKGRPDKNLSAEKCPQFL